MTQKPKLEPGDRVRVFSHYGPYDGEVTAVNVRGNTPRGFVEGLIKVRNSEGQEWFQHPRQCVKLRPKQKPEKERERAEFWSEVDYKNRGLATFCGPDAEKNCRAQCYRGNRVVRLLEVRPGEVVLGREELARAWTGAVNKKQENALMIAGKSHSYPTFEELCEALGLGKDKA